ncbi:MAG TPA: hypothetical protein VMT03_08085 [Polyangia bacterium]|nr:hypothetical protein [Polyangia bacterium]
MRRALMILAAASLAGCGGASSDPGITAYLQVANAQYVAGPLEPDPNAVGPMLEAVNLQTTKVLPGQENLSFSGSVDDGSSALIGLADDVGHWIVPASAADPLNAGAYQFQTKLSFSPALPLGTRDLIIRGVDAQGAIGPSQKYTMTIGSTAPAGQLVISLVWDTESDMDLHVLAPNPGDPTTPIEIYDKNPVGLPPHVAGTPPLTGDDLKNAVAAAGKLDFDSNGNCVIDGRRQENVVFTMPPPSGMYSVLVDAFSLCGQVDAQWQVTATDAYGDALDSAQWEATDADTRGNHGAGAGRLAFTFSIP